MLFPSAAMLTNLHQSRSFASPPHDGFALIEKLFLPYNFISKPSSSYVICAFFSIPSTGTGIVLTQKITRLLLRDFILIEQMFVYVVVLKRKQIEYFYSFHFN